MNTANSLASRVARLRNLRSESAATAITITTPLPGDVADGVQAFGSSYAQSRLWFLQQLEPGLTAYHMPALWRLRGELDVRALEQALAGLIERHPTLRTSFRLQGGEVLQLIHPPGAFALTLEEQEHLLLINHHHIASDGWSRSVLASDLSELYNTDRTGRTPGWRLCGCSTRTTRPGSGSG